MTCLDERIGKGVAAGIADPDPRLCPRHHCSNQLLGHLSLGHRSRHHPGPRPRPAPPCPRTRNRGCPRRRHPPLRQSIEGMRRSPLGLVIRQHDCPSRRRTRSIRRVVTEEPGAHARGCHRLRAARSDQLRFPSIAARVGVPESARSSLPQGASRTCATLEGPDCAFYLT